MKVSLLRVRAVAPLTLAALLITACTQNLEKTANNESFVRETSPPSRTEIISNHNLSIASDVAVESLASQKLMVRQAEHLISPPMQAENRERYAPHQRNQTVRVADEPVSTFSIDVDTGSYANVRRFLTNGQIPPDQAVRVEELLNYFDYDYAGPQSTDDPFSLTTVLGNTPWNNDTQLLHIGLKGYKPPQSQLLPANLVFLIDVSGSMQSPDKLGLLKSSISLLTRELKATDTVSIVVYAGSSGSILEPTAGNEHQKIISALSRLQAGGSTNGADGIHLAYQKAKEAFKPGGINRIILATDGDFNVGISDIEQLKSLISKQRASGIALTTLGFGTGNYNDHLMEQLADTGDGAYAYIDTLSEARKVLVDELHSTLMTIAKDVKIQIEFNPDMVSEYRLIGYSNRLLANEDFGDDQIDAGEIGAGHSVTALYEIALTGSGGERHSPRRYGQRPTGASQVQAGVESASTASEIGEIRLRYKLPDSDKSRLTTQVIDLENNRVAGDEGLSKEFDFSASVAAFGQLLAGDTRVGTFDYADARVLAKGAVGKDLFGYRAEFLRLLDLADSLHHLSLQSPPNDQSPDQG
jgi:Ca-activated chloride channel family protein